MWQEGKHYRLESSAGPSSLLTEWIDPQPAGASSTLIPLLAMGQSPSQHGFVQGRLWSHLGLHSTVSYDLRVIKMLWPMVSKAAARTGNLWLWNLAYWRKLGRKIYISCRDWKRKCFYLPKITVLTLVFCYAAGFWHDVPSCSKNTKL